MAKSSSIWFYYLAVLRPFSYAAFSEMSYEINIDTRHKYCIVVIVIITFTQSNGKPNSVTLSILDVKLCSSPFCFS